MKPAAWITVAVAAMVASVAWRFVPQETPKAGRPHVRGDAARMRPPDVWLAVVGVMFTLLSLAYLVTARGQERFAAVTILLFSIAILLVPISGRVAARSVRPRIGRVDGRPALVIPSSAAKLHQVLGIVCAAFFGLGGIASMVLARGPSSIELLPTGLRWRAGAKPSFVAWDAITAAWPFSIRNTWYLGLDGAVDVPDGQRWLAKVNRSIAHADAAISLEAFPVEPERLAEVVAACAADPERRREIGTQAGLARLG